MRKIYILLSFLVLTCTVATAQSSIAKLKYEDAEEAFAKDDFATTISKLEEAEVLLGTSNSKILHLKIMAQCKLIQSSDKVDLETVITARKNIDYYLKQYENNGPEEKYRDVYKASETLGNYNITITDLSNAKKGNQQSMRKLADANYFLGDYDTALLWYKKLADVGDKHALYMVGYLYDYSFVPQDYNLAFQYYTKAAEMNMPLADIGLAWLYYNGQGVTKDTVMALSYAKKGIPGLELMAKQGNIFAKTALAPELIYGPWTTKDYSTAFKYNMSAAEASDVKAVFQLGYQYLNGEGVTQDISKGISYVTKSANKGYVSAMVFLADLYKEGNGVPKDLKIATDWYTKAANKGYTSVMYTLGMMNMPQFSAGGRGSSVVTGSNIKLAYEWFQKAAEKGHTDALYQAALGYMMPFSGDTKKGVQYMKQAADQGHDDAAFNYATYNHDGITIPKNIEEALRYYTQAANNGHARSIEKLATIYEKGQGVLKDKVKAKEWKDKLGSGKKKAANGDVMMMLQGIR